ncbi:MAG: 50S ribosomal protein L29 [bacterium]|jgi:large subunit ribosomal protein L29|nr:50S ribosomal protein L29 [bacterium]
MAKTKTAPKDLRNLTDNELQDKYLSLKDEMFQLKIQQVTHQKVSNPMRFGVIRKDIARIQTLMNERRKK